MVWYGGPVRVVCVAWVRLKAIVASWLQCAVLRLGISRSRLERERDRWIDNTHTEKRAIEWEEDVGVDFREAQRWKIPLGKQKKKKSNIIHQGMREWKKKVVIIIISFRVRCILYTQDDSLPPRYLSSLSLSWASVQQTRVDWKREKSILDWQRWAQPPTALLL